MASMALDTLSISRELQAADMSAPQAEAIATVIGRAIAEGAANKADVRDVEHRIDRLELAIDGKLDRLKMEMLRWFLGSTVAIISAVIASAKLFE